MKSGASDPFSQEEQKNESEAPISNTDGSDQPKDEENPAPSISNTGQFDRSNLPRILARDKVKDDRDDVHQLFVYADTAEKEKEARRELEDRIGDVYKLDAREAIYLAGMQNLDNAEEILREWGADI